jgi:hypothetical protein
VRISHHNLKKTDQTMNQTKELVFVLDPPPDEEQKKKKRKLKKGGKEAKESTVSVKNFGAHLNIPKVKNSQHLGLAWRCRMDSQTDGAKVLMPIRPVAILNGMVDIDKQNFSLM